MIAQALASECAIMVLDEPCSALDYKNQAIVIFNRRTGEALSKFGNGGRNAGQFHWIPNLAIDLKGDIYTAEVDTGKRVQKFVEDDRGHH